MSIDRWIYKEDVVHTYIGILPSLKKEWNNPISSNIDGPREYYTKWSRSEKDKYHVMSLICVISKYELIYKTERDPQT